MNNIKPEVFAQSSDANAKALASGVGDLPTSSTSNSIITLKLLTELNKIADDADNADDTANADVITNKALIRKLAKRERVFLLEGLRSLHKNPTMQAKFGGAGIEAAQRVANMLKLESERQQITAMARPHIENIMAENDEFEFKDDETGALVRRG